jgi:hypothetical protein
MCQANLIAHWFDSAPDENEARRRRQAVEALVRLTPEGVRRIDGPKLLGLIARWGNTG